jgi:hypothetical protein
MNLAIKVLVSISLIYSCSTRKQKLSYEVNEIINQELTRNISQIGSQKVYLKFNLNDYMSEFLIDTQKNLNNNATLENRIGKEIFELVFNLDQFNYLLEQTKGNNNYTNLKFKSNIIYKNVTDDEEVIEVLSRANIFLSKPIFTKSKKYSLIAFSNGLEGEMQGGISIYRKDADDWKFVTTISNWIE